MAAAVALSAAGFYNFGRGLAIKSGLGVKSTNFVFWGEQWLLEEVLRLVARFPGVPAYTRSILTQRCNKAGSGVRKRRFNPNLASAGCVCFTLARLFFPPFKSGRRQLVALCIQ